MDQSSKEAKPLASVVYVMLIESYLFCGALFGLILFFQADGVLPIVPFTLVAGLGSSTLFMTVAVSMTQMGIVGMEERHFLHLTYAPGALVLGVVQASIHVAFSLVLTVISITILIWTSKENTVQIFFIFWFSNRIQDPASDFMLKVYIVVYLCVALCILLILWIIFVQTRAALGDVKTRRSHFSGLIQSMVVLFLWAQYQLDEITSKVCAGERSCTLADAAVFTEQSGLVQNAAIFLSILLVLDLFTAKTAAFFVAQAPDLWLIGFVTGRVLMLSGFAVVYLMFIELPMPMLTIPNYVIGAILLTSVCLETALLFSFKKQNSKDQKNDKNANLNTSGNAAAKRFFTQPLQVGTPQAPNRIFFRRDGLSRRKTEQKQA